VNEIPIVLPGQDELRERLEQVFTEPRERQWLIPVLLDQLGEGTTYATAVVFAFALAVTGYTSSMPMPASVEDLLMEKADQFIDAVVDDEAARAEAKEFLHSTD